MAGAIALVAAAVRFLPYRPSCDYFADYSQPLLSRRCTRELSFGKQGTSSWSSNYCQRSFERVLGSSTICKAESDDIGLKRERDRKRIEQVLPDFAQLEKGGLSSLLDLELESSYNLETARHYEVVFLVHENNVNELQDVVQKVKGFITEKKGKIWRFNDWGMRTLAYKIKKAKKANYILMNIQIGSQAINELNSLFEKDERVIRHLVIKRKQAITQDTVPPPEYRTIADEGDSDKYSSEEETDEEEDEELEETEEEEDEELEETEEEKSTLKV